MFAAFLTLAGACFPDERNASANFLNEAAPNFDASVPALWSLLEIPLIGLQKELELAVDTEATAGLASTPKVAIASTATSRTRRRVMSGAFRELSRWRRTRTRT